jgi:hypothetical protein
MSARRQVAVLVCGLWLAAAAGAEEQPEKDLEVEFLEYLGMWEQTDEDWLLYDVEEAVVLEERSEPAPEGEVSTEIENES